MALSIMAGVAAWIRANSALVALLGSGSPMVVRYYNGSLPQNPTYPALVAQLIDDVPEIHTHDQKVGPYHARIQFDSYALTTAAAEELDETLRSELAAYIGALGAFSDVCAFDEGRNPDRDFIAEKTLKSVKVRSRDFTVVY